MKVCELPSPSQGFITAFFVREGRGTLLFGGVGVGAWPAETMTIDMTKKNSKSVKLQIIWHCILLSNFWNRRTPPLLHETLLPI